MPLTPNEIEEIVIAEFAYWHKAEPTSPDEDTARFENAVYIGALGACSNIIAALYGHRTSWHPPLKAPTYDQKETRHNG